MQSILRLITIFILSGGLFTGCTLYYRMDIQQGNIVNTETVAQLKTGMTKRQVRFLLGTPLVQDPFHQSRWDYLYTLKEGGKSSAKSYRLTLHFSNDKLIRIEKAGEITHASDVSSDKGELKPGR
jgi:outer membrane protein assembly factor BamE